MIVHVLHHGLPLCGFTRELPDMWPEGSRWVRVDECYPWDEANGKACGRCWFEAGLLKGKEMKEKMSTIEIKAPEEFTEPARPEIADAGARIDIKGIGKAELLAALHNGTKALGMGRLHDMKRHMTVEEARDWIAECYPGWTTSRRGMFFDYVAGRPVKTDIGGDEIDPHLYDRDAGQGAAAKVVEALRNPRE